MEEDKKKFELEGIDISLVEEKLRGKEKKIFGSLKNGRIFASAFLEKTAVDKKPSEKHENIEIFWNMR